MRVRYAETDQMGRAHHSHYLIWCELGRSELMRERGISYAELERRGLFLPVSRFEIEYRGVVGYDELARIHTRIVRVRSRSIRFSYRVTREDGHLLAFAENDLVCTDESGRPARLPDTLRSALEAMVEEAFS